MKKWAYYNEFDKKAAAWLRELIKQGHIAPGEVDERSIKDVRPDDLRGFAQVHAFAGIGVWSYALRRAGWPDSRSVWTGSCPCQPFSNAGRGDGVADERHLWPHFFQLIAQCRPADVLGEQVASKDGLAWLDLVQSDMEAAGYAFGAADLCAAGVGAPHIRQRLFFAAKSLADTGRIGGQPDRLHLGGPASSGAGAAWEQRVRADGRPGGLAGSVADTNGPGSLDGQHAAPGWGSAATAERGGHRSVADTQRPGLQVRAERDICGAVGHDEGRLAVEPGDGGVRVAGNTAGGGLGEFGHALESGRGRHADGTGQPGIVGNTAGGGLAAVPEHGLRADAGSDAQPHGGAGGRGHADGAGQSAWVGEPRRTEPRPEQPAHPGAQRRPGPTHGHWAAADWIFCRDGKWRPVEPGTFPLAHGAPERVGRLRGYGNAIVAEVAEVFIASYLDIEGVIA